jgi:hypothetical protein
MRYLELYLNDANMWLHDQHKHFTLYHIDQYTRSSKDTLVVRFPYDTYLDHHTIDVEIYIYKPNDYGQNKKHSIVLRVMLKNVQLV